MSAPHVFEDDDFSAAPFFLFEADGNGVRDDRRFEYRDQMEKWKYARYLPGVESDAKLERIKLLRGEPGGRSK